MTIAIVNYNMGNLESVKKALLKINLNAIITNDNTEISQCDGIILPGVGAFSAGMKNINNLGLLPVLEKEVLINKKPFLGICLGMQLMADLGTENGNTKGFGWIPGKVVKIERTGLRVPHLGWNDVSFTETGAFSKQQKKDDFYFIHSYHFIPDHKNHICGVVDYGGKMVAALKRENIFAVQFHPEKSQMSGLNMIRMFFEEYA